MRRILQIAWLGLGVSSLLVALTFGEEKADEAASGPWITSVAWQSNDTVLGTRPQGLLFREAEVVRAAAQNPSKLEQVGQSQTSLWDVLPIDGNRAIASDYKGQIYLFGDGDAKQFELSSRWMRALSKTPDQSLILAGAEDGQLLVLSVDELKEQRRIAAHASAIFDITFNAAGDKLATAAGDGSVKLWSWPELEAIGTLSLPTAASAGKEAIWSVAFVDQDRKLVSGGANRAIQLWDVASLKPVVAMATAHNWVTSLTPLEGSPLVVAGCMDGQLLLVDWDIKREVLAVPGPGSAVWSVAASPDGQQVAIGTRKHGVAVMPTESWIAAGKAAAELSKAVRPPTPKGK